jgi:hypothetical protein
MESASYDFSEFDIELKGGICNASSVWLLLDSSLLIMHPSYDKTIEYKHIM